MYEDQLDRINWVIKDNSQSEWSFIRSISNIIDQKIDLLFLNTLQGRWISYFYFNLRTSVKTIIVAGRISEFFNFGYKLFNHKSIRSFLHHNYTNFFIQRILPKFSGMVVHTKQAKDFAIENDYSQPIILCPFSLYAEKKVNNHNAKNFNFVVTGNIVDTSRDHNAVLDVFESIWSSGYKDIQLTVLTGARLNENRPGEKYTKSIVDRMQSLKEKGHSIKFFHAWLSEDQYLKEARKADCFLSPLKYSYYSSGELTSSIVEQIRQGKPGIYPKGYIPDPNIVSSSLFYSSNSEMKRLILDVYNDTDLRNELNKDAIKNSQYYDLSNTSKRFHEELSRIN